MRRPWAAIEQRLQFAIQIGDPTSGSERFGSQLADEAGGHAFGRKRAGLLGRSRQRRVGIV
jgi:hypothetical protein